MFKILLSYLSVFIGIIIFIVLSITIGSGSILFLALSLVVSTLATYATALAISKDAKRSLAISAIEIFIVAFFGSIIFIFGPKL